MLSRRHIQQILSTKSSCRVSAFIGDSVDYYYVDLMQNLFDLLALPECDTYLKTFTAVFGSFYESQNELMESLSCRSFQHRRYC